MIILNKIPDEALYITMNWSSITSQKRVERKRTLHDADFWVHSKRLPNLLAFRSIEYRAGIRERRLRGTKTVKVVRIVFERAGCHGQWSRPNRTNIEDIKKKYDIVAVTSSLN